jgi:hypothetical protein
MQYCLCALILLLLKLIRADEFSQVHEKKNLYTLEVPNNQIDNWLSSSLVERQPGDPTLSRRGSRSSGILPEDEENLGQAPPQW